MTEPTVTLIRTCRVCACDDRHACPGGCWWVESDLCSACQPASDVDVREEAAA